VAPRANIAERWTKAITGLALSGRRMKFVNGQMHSERLKGSHNLGVLEKLPQLIRASLGSIEQVSLYHSSLLLRKSDRFGLSCAMPPVS